MSDALDRLDNNLSGDGLVNSFTNQVYLGKGKMPGYTTQSPTGGTYQVKPSKGDRVMPVAQARASYLTDEALRNSWLQTLKKNGVTTDPIKARALWDLSVAGASDWYATSAGTQKITPEQYLNWYLGGQKKTPKADLSRSIYQYSPEQLDAKANEIAQDVAGRTITDADKSATWYKNLMSSLNEMVMQGTVTEPTKMVKNPKTGKMENVTIQRPEVTAESISQKITSAIKEADPESVKRKQELDIEKWFLSQRGRG
ncbi:MAG: hypothetical protein EBR82_50350 [Caulobacteraceae bacterium]|nr:hypothetical protein [Caulobacteraceae bacterium]